MNKFAYRVAFAFLVFLDVALAESVTPRKMEMAFEKWALCSQVFKDFDYQNAPEKYKKVSVTIYKSDKEKLDKTFDSLTRVSKKEFGDEDTNKMVIVGVVHNGLKAWRSDLSRQNVQDMVDDCREWIYQ